MRKLLLGSAAILGASGGLAFAQAPQVPANPSQGQLAAPYAGGASFNSNNNAWGIANTPSGNSASGGLSTYGALGQNFYAVPAPGTVVIRLNGRVEADVGAGFTSLDKLTTTVTTPATVGVTGAVTPGSTRTVTYKQNPLAASSYMRLYPGIDGVSANGIRYGAQIELRENFQPAMSTSGTVQSPSIASPSLNSSAQTVFVRRAYTYIGSDMTGIVRMGQADGVVGLFDNCIFTSQCWDAGDGVFQGPGFANDWSQNATGAGGANFPWLAQAGAEYGNTKIVYLSPQFYGFDFAAQFAPNQGNSYAMTSGLASYPATPGPTSIASGALGGDALISTTTGNTSNRWYNQVGAGVRYENTFGAVDVKAYGFYEHAAGENANVYSTAPTGSAAYRAANANSLHYDPLSFYQFGVAVTSGGLTAAASYIGGRVNNQLALDTSGGVATNAEIIGLTYLNGPLTLGAVTGIIDTQGNSNLTGTSQRHQFEVAAGGNYKVAPGVNLVLEYDYYQTHQGDFNFATNVVGGGSAYNDVKGQALFFSTVVTW
jgi:hypothetical protein